MWSYRFHYTGTEQNEKELVFTFQNSFIWGSSFHLVIENKQMIGSRSLELLAKKLKGFQTSCCMKERACGSSICLVNQRMAAKSVGHKRN